MTGPLSCPQCSAPVQWYGIPGRREPLCSLCRETELTRYLGDGTWGQRVHRLIFGSPGTPSGLTTKVILGDGSNPLDIPLVGKSNKLESARVNRGWGAVVWLGVWWGLASFPYYARADGWVIPGAIHLGARGLDCGSTLAAQRRGGVEVGPVARPIGPIASCAAGGLAFWGADVLLQKRAPKLVWPFRVASVGASVWLASRNHRVARR